MAKFKQHPKTQEDYIKFINGVTETVGWKKSYNGRCSPSGTPGCMCGCRGNYSESERAVNGMANRINKMIREDWKYISEIDGGVLSKKGEYGIILTSGERVYGLWTTD